MSLAGWIIVGVLVWLAIAVVVGITVGPLPRRADPARVDSARVESARMDPAHVDPDDPAGGWLVHHCPRCNQNIDYLEPEQLHAVTSIHRAWCRGRMPS